MKDDRSGQAIVDCLTDAGFPVNAREIVPDEADAILAAVDGIRGYEDVRAILVTGGTGFAKRDVTVDTLRPRLVQEIDGFGELFRMLSWVQVGSAALLSRATAGVTDDDVFVFLLPGSTRAVELAVTKLIVPELVHLVEQRLGPS